jgi:hypothetical protein
VYQKVVPHITGAITAALVPEALFEEMEAED